MNKIKITHISRTIFIIFCAVIFIACASNRPHPMQYLVNKSYLQDIGLSKTVTLLDLKGDDKIKAIHIGTPNDVKVENFMTFNEYGDITSVSKEKGENVILKLVEFKYNKQGQLKWIVPHQQYFTALGYDSLKLIYQGKAPAKIVALKNEVQLWVEDVIFDDTNGKYLFSKKASSSSPELYNLYKLDNNSKLVGEYHRKRTADLEIDSTRYYYKNGLPYKKSEIFNASMVQISNYDEIGRPKLGTTMFYKKDSVAWIDKYYYIMDDRLPYSIITTSPMGWKEETNYFWEK